MMGGSGPLSPPYGSGGGRLYFFRGELAYSLKETHRGVIGEERKGGKI
jgi:hypothetical protein